MRRRSSRQMIYVGTLVVTLCAVAGFATATVYSSIGHEIGLQTVLKDPKGITLPGSAFLLAYSSISPAPSPYVLCGTAACSAFSSELIPLNAVTVGDLLAVTTVDFSASGGVPAQEQYYVQFAVSGAGFCDEAIRTPTVASGFWGSTAFDSVQIWCDLGTLTTPATTINLVILDIGAY